MHTKCRWHSEPTRQCSYYVCATTSRG